MSKEKALNCMNCKFLKYIQSAIMNKIQTAATTMTKLSVILPMTFKISFILSEEVFSTGYMATTSFGDPISVDNFVNDIFINIEVFCRGKSVSTI